MRPMNLHVTGCAIVVLRIQVVLRAGWLNRTDVMRYAVAGQAELADGVKS
jgi:hypothetical protein